MNMNLSQLINEILSEWAYRVDDGQPNPKNEKHLAQLSIVLFEMGLSNIKDELFENITEADKKFTNPILNKEIPYKGADGTSKTGIVGNLLRLPKGSAGRDAAEKLMPPEGSPERDSAMQDLGSEKDGKSTGGEQPQGKKPEDGGADGAGGEPKEDPIKAAAAMYDPKADPAMAARLDKEAEMNAKLADTSQSNDTSKKETEVDSNPLDAKFNPIDAKEVNSEMPEADPETFGGGSDIPDGVTPEELNKFNTDIQKVAQQVADAKAKGEPAPNVNLCDVTVPGTNLYCDDNLGIPRAEMPQFKGTAQPGSRAAGMDADASGEVDTEPVFKEMLKEKGIKTLQTEVPADKLKATQSELVGAKVVGMMGALEKDPNHPKITAPIYVSRDGYVIDGHHRWAAIVAYNAANPDKQIQMKTTVLDQDIKDAIPMANKFAEDMGIAAKKADANKETPTSAPNKQISKSAQKAIEKIKDGVKNWSVEEKEFFNKKVHNGNSPERRTFSETFKDKAKGAWESIKHGAKHEVHTFKEAGTGVKNFFSGGKVSESEKKALIEVAKKVAIAAAFGAAGGGLAHGAAAFGKHLMVEFIPHVVAETVLMGAGKAALFAGDEDNDADMMKFMEIISKKLESADIPNDVLADAISSYNDKKEKNPQKEMKEENIDLANELMLEMIYGFIDEAGYQKSDDGKYWVKSKKTGNVYTVVEPKPAQHDIPTKRDLKAAAVDVKPQPPAKKLGAGDFRKTPDMKPAVKKVTAPTPTKKERVETNNPHKKNGNEGKTILEIKPEELDSILEKYVNTGEATPDDMRELAPDYSNQDMADGYSDDDYYSTSNGGRRHSSLVRKKPYKVDNGTRTKLKESGFPEKYIKFLERCINTQVKGKKPPVTELIKQGGAGQIQSQFGEVMAMAFMSMRDPQQRRQLADIMSAEIAKSAEEFGGGKQSPIATKDWVEASLTHAEAFDSAMDEKYGKGQWRFEGAAWDIKGDVESLGLDYKNKGFSTDVMLRVQPLDKNGKPNGPARAQKNSLKKDENIFFFNGSINEVNNFVLNFLDDKERKRVKGYEAIVTKAGASNKNPEDRAAALAAAERITGLKSTKAIAALKQLAGDIRTKAFDAAPSHVQQAVSKVRNFGGAQTKSAESLIKTANTNIRNANNVIDNAKNIDGGDKDFAKFAYKSVKDCKASGTKDITTCIRQKLSAAGEDTTDDRVCKVAVLASKVAISAGDTKAEKALSKHYNLAVEAGNALMEVLPESPQLMGGLMQKLADAFPMKTCMQGEEFMCIDGMKVTQKTLQTVFGVANYDELQKGMKLKRLPTGETILVYGAKTKDGKDIPIGVVGARQKGKGYEGTVGFEISCSDDFALAISEANRKNGDTSESNEKARQSIGKRVNNRAAKANKKK
jgi:hypothetical protein